MHAFPVDLYPHLVGPAPDEPVPPDLSVGVPLLPLTTWPGRRVARVETVPWPQRKERVAEWLELQGPAGA
jgi:hypothetical protein